MKTPEIDFAKAVKKYYREISEVGDKTIHLHLNNLYLFALKNYETGVIDAKMLAYTIAGTMQFKVTEAANYKEIVTLAGELELPNKQISGDPEEMLSRLIFLIKSLPSSIA